MAEDFLSELIGNKNRARILRVFILNQPQVFSLAQVAKRSGLKPAIAGKEIKELESMEILKKAKFAIQVGKEKRAVSGKQKEDVWTFDTASKYALALSKFVHETSPVQHKAMLIALKRSGRLSAVVLSGAFMGDPTRPADLLVAADGINESRLETAIRGFESSLGREIRYATFTTPEFRYRLTIQDKLIRDTLEYPHLILLDKTRML